ncbi:ras-related protein Rab-32B-like isoform X2 [Dysidea avara]|uniref:ras-related protein Rab-32B-like isoform X2 n=1 Tax=Dysidea avara TaxID=196820 RepID=UPI0033202CAB
MTAAEADTSVEEHLYKVLVIGDFGVGKTSVIRRYTENHFSPNYKLTIGVDFSLKALQWDDKTKINLQLWDIAGHERFGHMTRVYYKYAIAAIIVFDLTRPASFESVIKWLHDVNQKVMLANEQPVPVILLANKSDLESVQITDDEVSKFCTDHKFAAWFKTSAKDGTNINEAMNCLVRSILNLTHKPAERLPEAISLKPVLIESSEVESSNVDQTNSATTAEKKSTFRSCCQD